MATLSIYRAASINVTVEIDEKTIYNHKLMGDHNVTCSFVSNTVLDIQIGDYIKLAESIAWVTDYFYINRIPKVAKKNSSTYQYDIVFESVLYNLSKKLFISYEGLAEYSYVGKPVDFITNIVTNINEIDAGWSVGTVDDLDEQTLSFTNETCRAALTRVAEAFKLEFEIIGKSISLTASAGSNTILSFTYGRNAGLYNLEREQVSDQNIVTKVYGFGGIKNIPDTYRGRARRLVFEERFLTKNVDLYGVIEGQFTDDNIYPKRTGTLSAVHTEFISGVFDPVNSYIEDSTLNFDVNSYLISGSVATMVFKSGDLSGQEFEIWKFDNTNHRFYINPYSDEDGYKLPNPTNVPGIGDSYTLVNISMPQTYIDDAETALKVATQAFIDENSIPMVVYSVTLDPKNARTNGISLKAGDRVTIVDSALGINNLIRVSGVSMPLINQYEITAVIADFVPYTLQERIINNAIEQKKQVVFVDRTNIELERRNVMRQNQLRDLIFDTDGYFVDGRIRPLSIETNYLSVGAVSRNFNLVATIKPNYLGDANRIFVSTGTLIHKELNIGGQYTWTIGSSLDQGSLTPTTAYYLYAKCSKSALTGEWVLTASQITAEQVAGFYHFLVGILFTVYDGWRDVEFMYGMTYINGRIITTGRIRSVSGYNYLDLDQNQFRIGDATKGLDWNVTSSGVLTIKGALVQNGGGITAPIGVFRGAYNAGYTYYFGDEATYGGSTWRWINANSGSGQTPAEGAYWTCIAAAGTGNSPGTPGVNGNYMEFQYAKNGSSVTAPSLTNTDLNPTGWSTTPPDTSALEYLWLIMAKKDYAGTVLITNWSTPVRIKGDSGTVGVSAVGMYQGTYIGTTTYYGTSNRVDIVLYNGLYYIARTDAGNGFSGHLPTDTAYWNPFGANFESVATSLLFASLAYVDNLGVKYFKGVPKPAGNLAGTVVNTQPHVTGVARVDWIALSGSSGSCIIKCNGSGWRGLNYTSGLSTTAALFVSQNYSYFYGIGVILSSSGGTIIFTARVTGTDFTEDAAIQNIGGDLNGYRYLNAANQVGTVRIDTITLSGTGGHADIVCDDTASEVIFETSLSNTAAQFIINYAVSYAAKGITVTQNGVDIVFTENDGNDFIWATSITNNPYCGAVKIVGNDIWEDEQQSHNGEITINQKSYAGGKDYWRKLTIGDGRGKLLAEFIGSIFGGRINLRPEMFAVYSPMVFLANLPTSPAGLASEQLYRNGNYLMIV